MSVVHCLGAFVLLQNFMPGGSMRHGIIDGRESKPHSRPYMVYLFNLQTSESCDGFLIHKNFVLTAAHCNGNNIVAFLGIHNNKNLKIQDCTTVVRFPHPDYNSTKYKNDIMLLKLGKPAEFNEMVMPIALPNSENEKIPENCLVMGWGCQSLNENNPSKVLLEVNVTISANKYCQDPNVICTKGQKGPGKGDSGGPLVCGDIAHGVVSTRIISNGDNVSKYIRISHYLDWIHSVINGSYKV